MDAQKICVIGTGDMGGAIVEALSQRTNHDVAVRGSIIGSASAAALIDRFGLREASDDDIDQSPILFVVVPSSALAEVTAFIREFKGIVVCVSVSPRVGTDGQKSTAEQIADALPVSRVVSAFTSIWSTVIRRPGTAERTSAFVCSDDRSAKDAVMELAEELGFDAIDGGALSTALYAETLGVFAVRLARDSGYGQTISFRAFQAEG